MNRKRKPADNAIEIGNKEEQIQVMGSCIFDLPKSILYIVLLKLPTRSILICKCLCKTWQDLISDHEFAKLHFAQEESYPLVRPSYPTRVSRTLYLVSLKIALILISSTATVRVMMPLTFFLMSAMGISST